ncbi:At-rich interactive domain-containing protein, partial [Thalictrum thalictroides]
KKRKFHQLIQRTSTAISGSAPKKPKQQNPVQLKEEQASLPISKTGLRSCVDSVDSSNQIPANTCSRNGSLRSRRRNISRIWIPQAITQCDIRDWSDDNGNVVQEFDDDSTTVSDELDTHEADTQTLLDGSVRLLVSGDGLRTDVIRFTFQDEVMQSWEPILDSHDSVGSSEISNPPVALLVSDEDLHTEVVRSIFQDETMQNCDPYDSISPMLAIDDPDGSSEVSEYPPGTMTLDGPVTLLVSSDGLHTEVVRPTFQDEPLQTLEPYDNFSPILIPNDSDSSSEISSPIVRRREDEVTNWIGQQSFDNDLDVSKWLGTKVVPNEGGDIETNSELIGSERSTSSSCDPPDYMECINDEFESCYDLQTKVAICPTLEDETMCRSRVLEKSLSSTFFDRSVLCFDLQAKVAVNSTLEEDEPMQSSEPDKTIEPVLDLNDSVDSESCYDIQTDVTSSAPPILMPDDSGDSVSCYDLQTKARISPRKSDEIISSILTSDDPMDSAKSSKVPRRSGRLSNFTGDSVVRTTIPISDRFQADLPKWIGPNNRHYNLESSKWLGTKIWPSECGNMDTDMGLIGKGRSDLSCSCAYPDSTECIKHHIDEKRRQLLSEIGDAFYSWGFDKMGEAVSESWILQEQNIFKSLFKRKTTMSKGTFWRRAFKRLPFKSRESIVSYYFNVFVLKNVRMQARLHPSDIDSDDDDEVDKVLHKSKSSKIAWL